MKTLAEDTETSIRQFLFRKTYSHIYIVLIYVELNLHGELIFYAGVSMHLCPMQNPVRNKVGLIIIDGHKMSISIMF